MQGFKRKTPLAAALDKGLLLAVIFGAGIAWFVYLWGVSLPALTAGAAYGTLLLLCAERFTRLTVRQREARIRRKLGGELALDALLTQEPRQAAFRAALWLDAPLELQRTAETGVLAKLNDKTVLVQVIALHPSLTADVQRLIGARREAIRCKADVSIVCLTCKLSREAEAYAEQGKPRLKLVPREHLLRLAGACSPATDDQLRALGGRRKRAIGAKRWFRHILDRKRAKRYFAYGAGLSLLYLLTGLPYYPLPALLCLALCLLCRVYRPKGSGSYWSDL